MCIALRTNRKPEESGSLSESTEGWYQSADGWSVAVHYRSSADGAQETADMIDGDVTVYSGSVAEDINAKKRWLGARLDNSGMPWPHAYKHGSGVAWHNMQVRHHHMLQLVLHMQHARHMQHSVPT